MNKDKLSYFKNILYVVVSHAWAAF